MWASSTERMFCNARSRERFVFTTATLKDIPKPEAILAFKTSSPTIDATIGLEFSITSWYASSALFSAPPVPSRSLAVLLDLFLNRVQSIINESSSFPMMPNKSSAISSLYSLESCSNDSMRRTPRLAFSMLATLTPALNNASRSSAERESCSPLT